MSSYNFTHNLEHYQWVQHNTTVVYMVSNNLYQSQIPKLLPSYATDSPYVAPITPSIYTSVHSKTHTNIQYQRLRGFLTLLV